tara:strand:+ start:1000 stop:1314 length:315 start_codon:yes stop_codon:yes gene_type:complete
MTVTTEEAERLAQHLETKSWRSGFPNDFYPEPSGGVFINGVFRGNTAAALRFLAAERDALQARVKELKGALRQIEYLDRPQIRGLPRRVTIQQIALAALEGKKA